MCATLSMLSILSHDNTILVTQLNRSLTCRMCPSMSCIRGYLSEFWPFGRRVCVQSCQCLTSNLPCPLNNKDVLWGGMRWRGICELEQRQHNIFSAAMPIRVSMTLRRTRCVCEGDILPRHNLTTDLLLSTLNRGQVPRNIRWVEVARFRKSQA